MHSIQSVAYKAQHTKCSIQSSTYKVQHTKLSIQSAAFKAQGSQCQKDTELLILDFNLKILRKHKLQK